METTMASERIAPAFLYFCHACGLRLRTEDVHTALARHESHNTVACPACAKQGKCIRRPQEYENQVFQAHQDMVHRAAPDPSESAPIAPAPKPVLTVPFATPSPERRRTQTRIEPEKRASTDELDTRRARGAATTPISKRRAPTLLIGGLIGGTSLVVIAGVLLINSSPKPPQTAGTRTDTRATVSSSSPTTGPLGHASPPSNSVNAALPQPGPTTPTPTAPVETSIEAELVSMEMPLNLYLKDKRFGEAFGRWKRLAAVIPPNDEKYADWRRKAQDYDRRIREGSQQLLSELLPKAKALAETGQAEELRRMFLPLNLEQLHPEDVERLRKDEPPWMELAQSKQKVADAAREAELAKLRESFEQSLPSVGQLGTLKGRLAFGPEAGPGVQLSEGAESLRKTDAKAAYFDGSRTIVLQKDHFDMIGPGSVILQYSSAQDFSIVLKIFGQQDISSTINLPAGPMQTKTIAVNNKRTSEDGIKMGYRGNWEGRGYGKIRIEFKNVKPGTLALFRVSY